MNSTTLIIILVVVFGLIGLAIRFGVNSLVNKAGNVIDKKIVDYKNTNNPAEAIRLADLYPELAASLRNNGPALPQQPVAMPQQPQSMPSAAGSAIRSGINRLISSESVRSTTAPVQAAPAPTPAPSAPVQNRPVRRNSLPTNRCCICGHDLQRGYAVLFDSDVGEARVDENCCNGIGLLARSQNKQEVYEAYNYFASLYPNLQPAVADYLANYLSAAEGFLRS